MEIVSALHSWFVFIFHFLIIVFLLYMYYLLYRKYLGTYFNTVYTVHFIVNMKPRTSTNWSLCCICQTPTTTRATKVEKLADQLLSFWENDLLPFDASLLSDRLVDGKSNFKECITKNNAQYHHNSYSNYTEYKLEIKLNCRKRRLENEDDIAGSWHSLRS